uniref:Chorismate mutase n=1 Tax=Kalanchoe fedtschenkoi TaxID=63787 RepID=A0A7N0SV51_KALFE
MVKAESVSVNDSASAVSLDGVRDALIRLEDTIVFSLIERAQYPINSAMYDESAGLVAGQRGSLIKFFMKRTEALQAEAGRYESEEENAFFPDCLPCSLVPSRRSTSVLHPVAKMVNINKDIWDVYINRLLPLFAAQGDDGNYALAAASDLTCLQAISRRIHYGKFVAEAKFLDDSQEYTRLIRARDRNGLMKLLTVEAVEKMVKLRVEKKAETFGQEVTLDPINNGSGNYKIDPLVVARLYEEWLIPLTKEVEVEYLLRRLD